MTSGRYFVDEWTLPAVTDHNEAFFTSGELRLATCRACAAVQHPPTGVCMDCGGMDFDFVATTPRGVVDSFTIVHHAVHPLLAALVPYNVVVVALRDHPELRVVGNVLDTDPADISIGLAVRCTWTDPIMLPGSAVELRLPQWIVDR